MSEHGELLELVGRPIAAWNGGDGDAFAELFVAKADYLTGQGEVVHGRSAIGALVGRGTASKVQVVGEPIIEQAGMTGRVVFEWATESSSTPGRRGRIACELARVGQSWAIERLANHELDESGTARQPNKGMKLTKLSAAPTLAPQAALGRRCRLMPAPVSGMDAGTASQLIPGVRRTSAWSGPTEAGGDDR
jgi:uncharacterized protein (TIGR02246 family)